MGKMLKPATRYAIITVAGLLTALLVVVAIAAGAQDGPTIANGEAETPRTQPPDLDPADCSDGTFITDPAANPGLVADCRTLVSIRNHWTQHTVPTNSPLLTWGTGTTGPITAWNGIRITDQRVEHITLSQSGIRGAIPAELSQLANLTQLDLSNNELTGTIPPQLTRLTNLTQLNLASNELTGTIPPQLGQLTNLGYLDLSYNRLTGSIPKFRQLTTTPRLVGNRLCPSSFNGKFCDDENNTHEPRIDTIAGWGITKGCDRNYYCPGDSITRQQMATFLHRAVTYRARTTPTAPDTPTLNDVEESPSLPYIQWAVAAGVMQAPEGQFNPRGTVTRGDMAEMMAAAFDHITPPTTAQGIFTDMTGQPDAAIRAAEALRTAGVTAGCSTSPLRYCPDRPVTRAQMASFFARALS